MKLTKILPGLAALVVCAAAVSLHAQAVQTIALSATELLQNTNPITKKGATTTPAPKAVIISTGWLLSQLARDEATNNNWPFTSKSGAPIVPKGARLTAEFNAVDDFSSLVNFSVSVGTNSTIVSDILSASATTNTLLTSGSYSTNNGPATQPFTETDYESYTVTYNSIGGGGTMQFTLTGLAKCSTSVPNANAKGKYTETDSFSFIDGTGGGTDANGNAIAFTGATITALGSASFDTNSP